MLTWGIRDFVVHFQANENSGMILSELQHQRDISLNETMSLRFLFSVGEEVENRK